MNISKGETMRTEAEMLTLIMTVAAQDERIRAVMMNGSRVNPTAKRDLFIESFLADHTWIAHFGERMIMR